MKKVAILGASGYTGSDLMRLVLKHSQLELVAVSSEKYAGMPVETVFPSLAGSPELLFHPLSERGPLDVAEYVFVALPHKEAMGIVPELIKGSKKVIDLSADFRLRKPEIYEKWYQKHTAPDLLKSAVYGLTEINREEIKRGQLVANPGCYPTAVLLALIPAVKNGLMDLTTIVVDAKSGVTGAGRNTVLSSLFAEVNEGVKPYKVGNHQHTPEIEQELGLVANSEIKIVFTPHLIPMNRGILVTVYGTLTQKMTSAEVLDLYRSFYQRDVFVRMCPESVFPSTNQVKGSNYCDIGISVDERTNRLIIIGAIDNLVKGASGQALQNMNVMAGFNESEGIEQLPLFP
jgi:N-acetyl-gamma-glutamyl-phosphate reductase